MSNRISVSAHPQKVDTNFLTKVSRFLVRIGIEFVMFIPAGVELVKKPSKTYMVEVPDFIPCTRNVSHIAADFTDQCANTSFLWALFDITTGEFCCCSNSKTGC